MFIESFRRICWPGFINFCGLDLHITGLKLDEYVLVFQVFDTNIWSFLIDCYVFALKTLLSAVDIIIATYGTTGKK